MYLLSIAHPVAAWAHYSRDMNLHAFMFLANMHVQSECPLVSMSCTVKYGGDS